MTFATVAVIAVFYVEWSALNSDFSRAVHYFSVWPWFWGSVTLSAITALLPFYFHWLRDGDLRAIATDVTEYGVGFIWFPVLVLYPGAAALGRSSDPLGIAAIVLLVLVQVVGGRYIFSNLSVPAQSSNYELGRSRGRITATGLTTTTGRDVYFDSLCVSDSREGAVFISPTIKPEAELQNTLAWLQMTFRQKYKQNAVIIPPLQNRLPTFKCTCHFGREVAHLLRQFFWFIK